MPNRLIHEQSPYLLQHAHNPVDWYPWSDEAFEKAKEENRPVIVSIGYAACHWCHVMERESFEDKTTADFMNEHFVCIKVDREEHPDVDHLYMDAVQAISGSGGWPLNVFVTPERVPFYGGTYFPPRPAFNRPSWIQLLERMHTIWTDQQAEVKAQAEQMIQYLKQTATIAMKQDAAAGTKEDCMKMADSLLAMGDKEWGGFGQAPKFPGTMAISFLLEQYHFMKNEPARDHALHSLDAMIDGGIYDQLGGGFARYSTDRQWLAPHFEKMLYDNALLVLSLCDAWQITGNERYKKIIAETIAFADRELKDPSGGYYSALDADSEGVEGKFYTWTWEEWTEALGNDEVVAAYFGVVKEGNWEHTNILHIARSIQELALSFGLPEADIKVRIDKAKEKLAASRSKRIRPHTDDKCLLSWNALMNLALTRAGVALERPDYLQSAAGHMQWMLDEMVVGGELLHTWKAGKARIPAKLDDYAYLIQAMIQLGSAAGNHDLIFRAGEWMEKVIAHFSQPETGFFYFTSDAQQDIVVRKVDVYDGATPSANAVMAHNLQLLGMVLERSDWLELAGFLLRQMSGNMIRYTYSFGYWAILQQRYLEGFKTAVVSGERAVQMHRQLMSAYAPDILPLVSLTEKNCLPVEEGKQQDAETLIFVCTANECLAPVSSVEAALRE